MQNGQCLSKNDGSLSTPSWFSFIYAAALDTSLPTVNQYDGRSKDNPQNHHAHYEKNRYFHCHWPDCIRDQ